ncbi:MAG: type II toxin-antitoxin system RelE/ParE family toxin [Chloroflexaceae bacterium]|jgi:toxin ParE1/3/4|nr:type II toxin-antitoxin system RelE/ParE family toxin [Chloroflexaceae bacterium]
MNIVWRPEAINDAQALLSYTFERNPEASQRLNRVILAAIARLADFPALGRKGRRENTRELVITGTRYIVAYLVEEEQNQVTILRVLDGAQQWPADFPSDI